MTATIAAVASTVAAEITAFRKSTVAAENKASPFARSVLASLVAGTMTVSLVESAAIHAFGNPKSEKTGKPIAKLSGLRDVTGGDAFRKTCVTVFDIFDNVDADKPVSDDEGVTVGAGTIRPLVVSFILSADGAPKSLKALADGVKAAVAAHAAATMPDNSEAKEENEANANDNGKGPADATPLPLIDRINMLAVAIGAVDKLETMEGLEDAFKALVAAWDDTANRLLDAETPADVAVNG